MKSFEFGRSKVSSDGPCYVIAEIGHNHRGELETALRLIKAAAAMGADCAKFQKRDNRRLFTKAMYNKLYENENSFGSTYGEHREFLEFGVDEYKEMMKCAEENGIEFMSTAFDVPSVDFLDELGVSAYKVASGDLTNTPLIDYMARRGKPMFVSTGAGSLEDVARAYETVLKHHNKLCLMHCTAGYPTEYENLNLRAVVTLKETFPDAVIGYSGHDNGILAPVIAYMMGATVVEKHFTMNRAWKGTDHKFSLEPTGMHKMVRDLHRVDISMGSGVKEVQAFEADAKVKMGKSLYIADNLPVGTVLNREHIAIKSPAGGIPPYRLDEFVGRKLIRDVVEDDQLVEDDVAEPRDVDRVVGK